MADLLERLKAALADRYAIEQEIRRGGMATVYVAEDLKHHRHPHHILDHTCNHLPSQDVLKTKDPGRKVSACERSR